MDEKHRIIKQIFNTFFFRIIALGLAPVRFLVILKNLNPAETGAYSLIQGIVDVGLYVCGLSLYNYLNRFVPGAPEEKRNTILK